MITQTLQKLIPFLWSKDRAIRLSICASLVFTALMIALNVGLPLIFKTVINRLSTTGVIVPIVGILALYGSLWTIEQIISQLRSITLFRALERGTRMLCLRIFDQLHTLGLRFHLQRRLTTNNSFILLKNRTPPRTVWRTPEFVGAPFYKYAVISSNILHRHFRTLYLL